MKTHLLLAICASMALFAAAQDAPKQTPAQQKASDAQPQPTQEQPKIIDFEFGGALLGTFIEEVKAKYGVDLLQIGTIPQTARNSIQVPKMKIRNTSLSGVLYVYNTLSKDGVPIGTWVVSPFGLHPRGANPEFVVFLPPEEQSQTPGVRAFGLTHHQAGAKDKLMGAIAHALSVHRNVHLHEALGESSYHEETRMLVAVGNKRYIDLVTEVVGAFKENVQPRF